MITTTATIQRKPDVMTAEVDGEIVLMSLQSGYYFGLNGVSSDIWRRIESPIRIDALCNALAEAYTGDRAQIETDVLTFLNALSERQLLDTLP